VASAPPPVAEGLRRLAWAGADEDEDDDEFHRYDVEDHRRRRETGQWGIAHGLLAGSTWGWTAPMPAEVALALRGADYRAPFAPTPPAIRLGPVAPEVVESAATAAIGAFLSHALALLDRLTRTPVPLLAAGGVGVRELGRLTKALGVEEFETRLLLAFTAACGLLLPNTDGLGVSHRFDEWRRRAPAGQAADLLATWWELPSAATRSQDADGKKLPVFAGQLPGAGCQAARMVLLRTAAELPAGQVAEPGDLAAVARWHRPLIHVLPQDADAPLTTTWREAELLGAVAAGALSPLGTALLSEDEAMLVEQLTRLLPRASDTARFGSDLTALVPGTPSAVVSTLLDSCADRESSGGAVTWRFSPTSIRRAMDEGAAADGLVDALAGLTDQALPQTLTCLIQDVARRHGKLRIHAATSLILSDYEALLAEVAVDKRLAKLGLTLIAPTVLGCSTTLDVALARLREVGYFPVAEGVPARPSPRGTAAARVQRTPEPRTVHPAPGRLDEGVLASRLLAAPSTGVNSVRTNGCSASRGCCRSRPHDPSSIPAPSSAAATASNSASAVVGSSTISRAMTSGAGRLSRSSREASFNHVMSRLASIGSVSGPRTQTPRRPGSLPPIPPLSCGFCRNPPLLSTSTATTFHPGGGRHVRTAVCPRRAGRGRLHGAFGHCPSGPGG
jgi:hypothetical protein